MSLNYQFSKANPNRILEYVLEHYFRVQVPAKKTAQFDNLLTLNVKARQHFAKIYNYPDVIEQLAVDPSPTVRSIARQNPYWNLVGQFKPLLTLSYADKIKFIQSEGLLSLFVFIVFETDLKVLKALFENPNISLPMLQLLRRYIQKRGKGIEDRLLNGLISSAIMTKKKRLTKFSEIAKVKDLNDLPGTFIQLETYIIDKDDLVVKNAVSVLEKFEFNTLWQFLFDPALETKIGKQRLWQILNILEKHYHCTTSVEKDLVEFTYESPINPFKKKTVQRKLALLDSCEENLSHYDNFYTLVIAHLDQNKQVRKKVTQIVNIDDLIALLTEPTFPVMRASKALSLLRHHPFPGVRKRLEGISSILAKRSHTHLKNLETTINASLDVIFDFGKSLLAEHTPQTLKSFKELDYVYELINNVLNFPGQFLKNEGYSFEDDADIYKHEYDKIYSLWKATIGQYLGRFKDLDEMIQHNWVLNLPLDITPAELRAEREQTICNLERDYKKAVRCHLNIACVACQNRGCASERFLVQIDFFLSEVIDILYQQAEALPIYKTRSY